MKARPQKNLVYHSEKDFRIRKMHPEHMEGNKEQILQPNIRMDQSSLQHQR
jgi:hypothetical protein